MQQGAERYHEMWINPNRNYQVMLMICTKEEQIHGTIHLLKLKILNCRDKVAQKSHGLLVSHTCTPCSLIKLCSTSIECRCKAQTSKHSQIMKIRYYSIQKLNGGLILQLRRRCHIYKKYSMQNNTGPVNFRKIRLHNNALPTFKTC